MMGQIKSAAEELIIGSFIVSIDCPECIHFMEMGDYANGWTTTD